MSASGFPVLDKYELLEELGHGGMATVYRARDLRLDREVAVKVIHKHLRDNPEVRRRFVAEAKAVAKLRHPCIVDVYDVSDDDDVERYLVVELVRGTTLRDLLTQQGCMPAEIGAAIHTGARLYTETPKSNPARRAYELYTHSQNRESWDLTAALCAVRGVEPYWSLGGPGRCHVTQGGGDEWELGHKSRHAYLVTKMPLPEITKVIEDLLVQAPRKG